MRKMPMQSPHNVVILGSVTIDFIEQPAYQSTKRGGVTIYAGLTFRQHGVPTTIVTNVAAQHKDLLQVLDEHAIPYTNGVTPVTTTFRNINKGDARRQYLLYKAAPISADQAKPAIEKADHVHLGPLHEADLAPEVFPLIAKQNALVSLDIQGYAREVGDAGLIHSRISPRLTPALRCATIIKGSDDEIDALLSYYQTTPAEFLDTFAIKEMIVTAGSRGGQVWVQGGDVFDYVPAPVPRVVDPTGAGDVFFAAYLIAHFYRNDNVQTACCHAAAIVAQHIEGQYIEGKMLQCNITNNSRLTQSSTR